VLDSDRTVVSNSDGVARIDSGVVVVIDLDVMMAISSGWVTTRVEADNSEGVASAESDGVVEIDSTQ
jgi:hypothetical protein